MSSNFDLPPTDPSIGNPKEEKKKPKDLKQIKITEFFKKRDTTPQQIPTTSRGREFSPISDGHPYTPEVHQQAKKAFSAISKADTPFSKDTRNRTPDSLASSNATTLEGTPFSRAETPLSRGSNDSSPDTIREALHSISDDTMDDFTSDLALRKHQLIETLGIQSYPEVAQKKIISCYLSQSPSLNLKGCALNEIPKCLSEYFPFLKKLDVSYNQIENCSFEHAGLTLLNIRDNPLHSISVEGLPMLEEVNYVHTSIHASLRRNISEDLGIQNLSPKAQERIISCYLGNEPSLDLTDCGLTEIPKCLSTHFPELRSLYLSENKITHCDLRHSELTTLNMRGNKLTSFDGELPKVTTLNVAKNSITRLYLLDDQLPSLRNLNISHNKLKDLPKNLVKLQVLHCVNNQITSISIKPKDIPQLSFLDIRGNDLLEPFSLKFPKLKSQNLYTNDILDIRSLGLQNLNPKAQKRILTCFREKSPSLDLSNCGLTEVPPCIHTCLFHITHLNLSHNDISAINISLKNITVLNMSYNKFVGLPDIPGQFPKAESLDFSYNKLEDFLPNPPNLKHLNIAYNSFKQFTPPRGHLNGLQSLDISGNKLSYFFARLPSLTKLNAAYNRIVGIDLDQSRTPSIKSADLSHNQIDDMTINTLEIELLDISHNRLTVFPEVKEKLTSLHSLNTSHNFMRPLSEVRNPHIPVPLPVLKQDKAEVAKANLIKSYGLDLYSKEVQNIIVDCIYRESDSIDLSDQGLEVVPPCLAELHHLTDINLSGNTIKEVTKRMRFVKILNLSNNEFRSFSVKNEQFPRLKDLDLSGNEGLSEENIHLQNSSVMLTLLE
jgi:Leucine-rich repeat (LRR) protein